MEISRAATAHDILVFGRGGTVPVPGGGWALSKTGMEQVEAVVAYIKTNRQNLSGTVRVQFSAGWLGGEGKPRPPKELREAALMDAYAEKIGLKRLGGQHFNLKFGAQSDSRSTISDAVGSAQSGFFGARPFAYGPRNPLGVVAHHGPAGSPGHLGRCLYAARKAFGVKRSALLPIAAEGEDVMTAGIPEAFLTRATKLATIGAHSYRSLLQRDRLMLRAIPFIQKHLHIFSA